MPSGIWEQFSSGKRKKIQTPPKIKNAQLLEIYNSAKENNFINTVFAPVYQFYNKQFFYAISENIDVKGNFTTFKDTATFEKYMLNYTQFSAAKSLDQSKQLQAVLFNENGTVKGFSKFTKDAESIVHQQNEVWLRVEYDTARKQAVAADQWNDMVANSDYYPYWVYRGMMDSRERPDHVDLEGKTYRIGDAYGDSVFPPADFNCRCVGEPADDRTAKYVRTTNQAKSDLEKYVDEQFRYNPAKQGMLPKIGGYFKDEINSANDFSYKLFSGLTESDDYSSNYATKLATGLHFVLNMVEGWRNDYHTNNKGDIVFQNKSTFTNVILNHIGISNIQKHSRGLEQLPKTISKPSEIWATWADPSSQQIPLRNYISIGKKEAYIVQTKSGIVTDAFIVSASRANSYRKGVILL